MQKDFTYVSLFSGIGGFEKALNKHGGECVLASEIDKFATQSYKVLYGENNLHGDITKIDAKDIPDHDLLVGGFPCQSFSAAGLRKGFDDTRGTLFFDIARIASEKQPKALLLENVKGLVGHKSGKTLDKMIKTLNEIGYVVDFDVLNSKYFGVPQSRERIFIIAIREDLIDQEDWLYTKGQTIVPKGKRRISDYEWAKTFNFDFPNSEIKYNHYTKSERDRIHAARRIMNDIQASKVRKDNAKKRIEELESTVSKYSHLEPAVNSMLQDVLETGVDEKYYFDEDRTEQLVTKLRDNVYAESNDKKSNSPQLVGRIDVNGHDYLKRVYGTGGMSPTIPTGTGGGHEPKIAEKIIEGQVPQWASKSPEKHTKINDKYRIRKLTPLECFRLQGFSDEAHQRLVDAGLSDSQRYKQAGNAVTTNVVYEIMKKLLPLIHNEHLN